MKNDPTQPPHQDTPPNLPISHEKGAGATAKEQRAPNDQAESQKLDKAEKVAAAPPRMPAQADRGERPPAGT